ncbi:hypothetical protein [Kribbella caucasensis]|uniref:hypothetical protein n=1 Tax=Kribbella caucasensis TaxID=2512215 RepID=UPI00192D4B8A|nr:hypothetical protein [Kribbella sp. VKM Ac-2527]
MSELTTFLSQRGHGEIPDTVADLIDDVTGLLTHLGHVTLIECADPGLARLIARDLPTHCRLIGDHHLAVPIDAEPEFRASLPWLGSSPGS